LQSSDENSVVKSLRVAQHILVIMPNWLGDAVMATPFLRALRNVYPTAQIACLGRPLIQPVLSGLPLIDAALLYVMDADGRINIAATAAALKKQNFDLAIILPNSVRTAYLAWRAGIPRRLGYNRDGRRLLLTHWIAPVRRAEAEIRQELLRRRVRELIAAGRWSQAKEADLHSQKMSALRVRLAGWNNFQPLPAIDYYLALSTCLGGTDTGRQMMLGITQAERLEADNVMAQAGLSAGQPFMLLFPGAHFGASKCWPPERFAKVAAAVADPQGPRNAAVLIGGASGEKPLIDAIMAALPDSISSRVLALYKFNDGRSVSLGAIKELVRNASLVLCNDTGPRHFAAAMGTPLVTLFGPTDPRWAEIFYNLEQQVAVPVPCGPCQLKRCPIDHRCMTGITPEMVVEAVARLWRKDAS
jgi:heptosyltransferase-2